MYGKTSPGMGSGFLCRMLDDAVANTLVSSFSFKRKVVPVESTRPTAGWNTLWTKQKGEGRLICR
ncbi:MAG: hypothetical protein LC649_07385 [Bacteroidales bacterium]|nr:hypothetical protein [Bacteroidales bacterium]